MTSSIQSGAGAHAGSSSGDILRDGEHIFYTKRWQSGNVRLLLSYEGPGGEVKVPEGVAGISEEAFAFCTHVTDVILPEGVWLIGRKAFFRSGIRTVSLPGTLKYIEEFAFARTPLAEADIPDGTEKVENGVSLRRFTFGKQNCRTEWSDWNRGCFPAAFRSKTSFCPQA